MALQSKSQRFLLRLAMVGAALLTVILLTEAGLRLAQQLALGGLDSAGTGAASAARILCLGDSWTYGMESGDPATLSYPAQLQAVLDRGSRRAKFQVLNMGRPGLTSRHLLASLPADLERHHPALLVVMVGPGNFFQTVGRAGEGGSWGLLERSRAAAVIRLILSPVGSHFAPPSPGPVKDALAAAIAERSDEQPPVVVGGEAQARLERAQALYDKAGVWTAEVADILRQLVADHPRFIYAWRLLSLADLTVAPTVCSLRFNLEQAKLACPACRWVNDALAIMERQVSLPGRRALEADLANILTRARLAGVRVLLLNYPTTSGDPCSNLARRAVAAAARRAGAPLLDMEEVLGRNTADLDRRADHWGDHHPKAKGYGLMAEAVRAKLVKLGWVSAE